MAVQREWLVVAIGKFVGTLVDDGLAMQVASGIITLAGKRLAHEDRPRRAAGDLAAVFDFVAFADERFHILIIQGIMNDLDLPHLTQFTPHFPINDFQITDKSRTHITSR